MVQFSSMTFGYGRKPLFDGLDLKLEAGSAYGLLGLNGAGKTSLLKLAAGALRPTSGAVSVFGRDPGRRQADALADIAFVPDDPWAPAILPSQWLDRYSVFRPAFDRERFAVLMAELALEPDKKLSAYSFGQRKKFALAAAIASGARLLLLDEPTNGLDIPTKTQFRRILASASEPGRVVVVSTHQVRDLANLIDPVLIVHGGRLLFEISADEMGERLCSARLRNLDRTDIVYAERDAVGYSALLAGRGEGLEPGAFEARADIELVFNAAIAAPQRLRAALAGESVGAYSESACAQAAEVAAAGKGDRS